MIFDIGRGDSSPPPMGRGLRARWGGLVHDSRQILTTLKNRHDPYNKVCLSYINGIYDKVAVLKY